MHAAHTSARKRSWRLKRATRRHTLDSENHAAKLAGRDYVCLYSMYECMGRPHHPPPGVVHHLHLLTTPPSTHLWLHTFLANNCIVFVSRTTLLCLISFINLHHNFMKILLLIFILTRIIILRKIFIEKTSWKINLNFRKF